MALVLWWAAALVCHTVSAGCAEGEDNLIGACDFDGGEEGIRLG